MGALPALLLVATTASASLVDDGGCALCHAVPSHPPASREDSCQGCHVWIRSVAADPERDAAARRVFPLWDRYTRTVASYLEVPDLRAASRLEGAWIAEWLADPHDVRPLLPEGMPRSGLTAEQRTAVAAFVVSLRPPVPVAPPPDPSRVERGAAVFTSAGCAGCHTFGRLHTTASVPLAPDLVHTRDRMEPDVVAAWLAEPRAFSPDARMPAVDLSAADRLAVRDYVLLADAAAAPAPVVGIGPGPSGERVVWAQVEARVFGRVCVHCHMDPTQNDGRAGPGNAGGFGWDPTGLELQTYESVKRHGPAVLAALERRRVESARDTVAPGQSPASGPRPARPGMPLGLPALSDADHQLVVDWYAAGAPLE